MIVDSRNCGLVDAVLSGWYNYESGELLKGFKVTAEDVVLDFGCGAGAATMFCAKAGAYVIFSDVEPAKLRNLEERLKPTHAGAYESLISESLPLPIADASATKVIAMEVLEHVENPEATLSDLFRIAKPGAQFLITVPAAEGEELQKGLAPDMYFKKPNHLRIFSSEDFRQLVTDSGLSIEFYTTGGFFWALWMLLYWATQKNTGVEIEGAVLDNIAPPFHPLLQSWAATWQQLIDMPEGLAVKEKLDQKLPKTQAIIARKPSSQGLRATTI